MQGRAAANPHRGCTLQDVPTQGRPVMHVNTVGTFLRNQFADPWPGDRIGQVKAIDFRGISMDAHDTQAFVLLFDQATTIDKLLGPADHEDVIALGLEGLGKAENHEFRATTKLRRKVVNEESDSHRGELPLPSRKASP